jgi:rhodanese-related sulfurtransferase
MGIPPFITKQNILRINIILIISLILGLIYNQLHPNGLHWRFLFSTSMHANDAQKLNFTVISADSAFLFLNQGDVVFVDTREPQDFQLDHIRGAINVPLDIFITASDKISLPRDKTSIIMYDEDGNIEKLVSSASVLNAVQIKKLYILYGGYLSWLNLDYPLDQVRDHE